MLSATTGSTSVYHMTGLHIARVSRMTAQQPMFSCKANLLHRPTKGFSHYITAEAET
jgi:hypothetical protein